MLTQQGDWEIPEADSNYLVLKLDVIAARKILEITYLKLKQGMNLKGPKPFKLKPIVKGARKTLKLWRACEFYEGGITQWTEIAKLSGLKLSDVKPAIMRFQEYGTPEVNK